MFVIYIVCHPYYDTLVYRTCYIVCTTPCSIEDVPYHRAPLSRASYSSTSSSNWPGRSIPRAIDWRYMQSSKMILLKLCLLDRKRHIWIFLHRQRAPIYPGPAWRCRRRCILVISRYISYHMYLHITVPDSLARRKPWGLRYGFSFNNSKQNMLISFKQIRLFLFIHICEYV